MTFPYASVHPHNPAFLLPGIAVEDADAVVVVVFCALRGATLTCDATRPRSRRKEMHMQPDREKQLRPPPLTWPGLKFG